MGYPMTYRRVVNRNGLADGGYDEPPRAWWAPIMDPSPHASLHKLAPGALVEIIGEQAAQGNRLRDRMKMVAGDLRRLERDALDEKAICQSVAHRTGIDPGVCAAVIAAFMDVP